MAYDLEEQESLAEIKAWWDKWGTLILTIVTVCCLAAAGLRGWQWYQMKQAQDAGGLYAMMIQATNSKDPNRVQLIAKRLQDDYASTAYAGMGALLGAYSSERDNKSAEAVKDLEWVLSSEKQQALHVIAAVRLAGIYLDQANYDKGLSVLNSVKATEAEKTIVDDRKGDIYVAMGDFAKAKEAWTEALRSATSTNPLVRVIELKMSTLPKSGE